MIHCGSAEFGDADYADGDQEETEKETTCGRAKIVYIGML